MPWPAVRIKGTFGNRAEMWVFSGNGKVRLPSLRLSFHEDAMILIIRQSPNRKKQTTAPIGNA